MEQLDLEPSRGPKPRIPTLLTLAGQALGLAITEAVERDPNPAQIWKIPEWKALRLALQVIIFSKSSVK
jgi:hypothetical protein